MVKAWLGCFFQVEIRKLGDGSFCITSGSYEYCIIDRADSEIQFVRKCYFVHIHFDMLRCGQCLTTGLLSTTKSDDM